MSRSYPLPHLPHPDPLLLPEAAVAANRPPRRRHLRRRSLKSLLRKRQPRSQRKRKPQKRSPLKRKRPRSQRRKQKRRPRRNAAAKSRDEHPDSGTAAHGSRFFYL